MPDTAITRDNIVPMVCAFWRHERGVYKNFLSDDARRWGHTLLQTVNNAGRLPDNDELIQLSNNLDRSNCYAAVFAYSVLYRASKSAAIYDEWVKYVIEQQNSFSPNTLYFLYGQIMREKFLNATVLDTTDNKKAELVLHNNIADLFQNLVPADLSRVPLAERNPQRIIVLINQQLMPPHAPSVISLNYCEELINSGYDVTLVNTAEVLSQVGNVPLATVTYPNYVHQWGRGGKLNYNGVNIPYIQMPLDMPNPGGIAQIMNFIRAQKPILLLCVGVGGITMHLADKIVPALSVPLGSGLPILNTYFTTHGKTLTAADKDFIKLQNGSEKNMVLKPWHYGFAPQREHISRSDVNIPDESFIMAVVGNRLDEELDRDFLSMLDRIATEKTNIMFIGNFNCDDKTKDYPNIKNHSIYLGHCADLLSRLELCDIFVNPRRSGGGTSGAMALYQGKPVVTVAFGDIAECAGEQFWVRDYAEMEQQISRYINEPVFYAEMSQKAKQRGIILTDNTNVLRDALNEAIMRCRELEL